VTRDPEAQPVPDAKFEPLDGVLLDDMDVFSPLVVASEDIRSRWFGGAAMLSFACVRLSRTVRVAARLLRPVFAAPRALFACLALGAGVVALVPPPTAAEQVNFDRTDADGIRQFAYRIEDSAGDVASVAFALPIPAIDASYQRFQAHDPADLRAQAKADRMRQTEAMVAGLRGRYPQVAFSVDAEGTVRTRMGPPDDFETVQRRIFTETLALEMAALRDSFPSAEITEDDQGYRISAPDDQMQAIQSGMQAAQRAANEAIADYVQRARQHSERDFDALKAQLRAELSRIEDSTEDFSRRYFHERYYRLSPERLLLPDYARLGRAAVPDLAPVADAIAAWSAATDGSGADQRALVNRVLLFTQSIPYSPLLDREDSIGFLAPLQLLDENRGDCDSKAVLFAALVHRLYPDLPVAMVLLSSHAYVGLGVEPAPGDAHFHRDDLLWTLAEPVGPGHTRLGELSEDSAAAPVEAVLRLF
jgi:hypothetical protein